MNSDPDLPRRHVLWTIHGATEADLSAIREWLVEEESRGVEGNFLCNWEEIENAQRTSRLLVCVDGSGRIPVAFEFGGLIDPGIMQVRKEFRGRGIGRKLVDYCVQRALESDECLLYIQCKPPRSIPFWEKMGFKLVPGNTGENYAYRVLEKPLELPSSGTDVEVAIRFFPESCKWKQRVKALVTVAPQAKETSDGRIWLAERALFHKCAFPDALDVVIEIEVNGRRLFLDKAKYPLARNLGVKRCSNGFYIDVISPQENLTV